MSPEVWKNWGECISGGSPVPLLGLRADSHSVNPEAASAPPTSPPNLSIPLASKVTWAMCNQEPQRRNVTGKSRGRKKK